MHAGSPQDMSMKPWLHFTSGDYVLFHSWRPVSAKSMFGTCMGLFLLGAFDRWLSATRSMLERYWRHKALNVNQKRHLTFGGKQSDSKEVPIRTIQPFILEHDVPRGFFHAAQALLSYTLMLSIMNFNLAYLVSVVAGLGIGEMIFGRIKEGRNTHK